MSDSEEERGRNDSVPSGIAADDKAIVRTVPSSFATKLGKAGQRENQKFSPEETDIWRTTPTKRDGSTRKQEYWKWKDSKVVEDEESSNVSASDICRICHMGGFPALTESRPMWEWQNQGGVRRDASQISTLSSYAYLGPLISACKCRGTVGLIHAECLERWLTESGHTRCELCGHKYATKRVPRHSILRSIGIWFRTVIATRQTLLDVLYLTVTTPLALFSCYVCALALKMVLDSGFYEIPWMFVAMLPTCSLTLVAYWGWLITLGRYISRLHGRRWRRFWRNNFVVRLRTENASDRPAMNSNTDLAVPSATTSLIGRPNVFDDDLEERQNNEPEELLQIF